MTRKQKCENCKSFSDCQYWLRKCENCKYFSNASLYVINLEGKGSCTYNPPTPCWPVVVNKSNTCHKYELDEEKTKGNG